MHFHLVFKFSHFLHSQQHLLSFTFLIITILIGVKVLITQSCLILCDPMDCSPSGSSVHGILWARILEWVTIPFSREYSQPRDWTQIYCIAGGFFTIWAIRDEVIFYMGLGLYFPGVEWFWILFNIPDGWVHEGINEKMAPKAPKCLPDSVSRWCTRFSEGSKNRKTCDLLLLIGLIIIRFIGLISSYFK